MKPVTIRVRRRLDEPLVIVPSPVGPVEWAIYRARARATRDPAAVARGKLASKAQGRSWARFKAIEQAALAQPNPTPELRAALEGLAA